MRIRRLCCFILCLALLLSVTFVEGASALGTSDPMLRADVIEEFIQKYAGNAETGIALLWVSPGSRGEEIYYLSGYFKVPAETNFFFDTRNPDESTISTQSPKISETARFFLSGQDDSLNLKSLRESGELFQDEYYYLMGYLDACTPDALMNGMYAEIVSKNYNYRGYVLRPAVLNDCATYGIDFDQLILQIERKLLSYNAYNKQGFAFAAVQMQKENNKLNDKNMLKKAYLSYGGKKSYTMSYSSMASNADVGLAFFLKELTEGRDYVMDGSPLIYDDATGSFDAPVGEDEDQQLSTLPFVRFMLKNGKTVVLWCGQ